MTLDLGTVISLVVALVSAITAIVTIAEQGKQLRKEVAANKAGYHRMNALLTSLIVEFARLEAKEEALQGRQAGTEKTPPYGMRIPEIHERIERRANKLLSGSGGVETVKKED